MNKKSILITGGTGSFGKRFIKTVLEKYKPKKLIVFSRDEQKQFQLQQVYKEGRNSPIRYFLGDVRDLDRLNFALRDVDIVIHAAALKHVPMAEYNPFEVVKTNIIGAQNVIQASLNNEVEKVVALSTDKASSPINLYGATKLASDKIFIAANNYAGKIKTKFSIVRYGNVMGSRGSVIPYFLKNQKNKTINITDPRMTRFNITLSNSVNFVIECLNKMWGGEIFVPKIPSYKITDLAKAICPNSKIRYIGVRPGEKIDEEMISINESFNSIEFKNYFVIMPNLKLRDFKKEYKIKNKSGKLCPENFSYNSRNNKNFITSTEINKLIKNNIKDFEQ
jgi:UDP-N-acetylglucosamine 4,6-dehydratase